MRPPLPHVLAAALLALAPGLASGAEKEAKARPNSTPAVTVVPAAERELVERVVVTGTLVPRDEILVAPEIEGYRITEVLVEEGGVVAKGQVLARLNRDLLTTQLAQNAASLARAESAIAQAKSQIVQAEAAKVEAAQALERARSLIRGGNTTEAILEQRTSAARAAEGRLAAARDGLAMAQADRAHMQAMRGELEVKLARTEIRAPEAGIVSRRSARVGGAASAVGEPLFRIIARGEIELEGEVTETQMPRLREGAPAALASLDGGPPIAGRVRVLYPEIDRLTRLGKVRIALPKDPSLRIGAFARGTVEAARRTGVAVPLPSVVYGAGGVATVLVAAGNRVEARPVRTGLSSEGFVEVLDKLKPGELVVARAGSFLRDGDVVRPVLAGSQTARAGE